MDPYQSVIVVNRRSIKYEGMFNGICLVFQPHEKKSYPPNVAIAIVTESVLRTNLATGVKSVFALGIEKDDAYPTNPLEGEIAFKNPVEQMDRRDVQRLTETEPKALGANGLKDLGIGKSPRMVAQIADTQTSPVEGEGEIGGPALEGGVPPAAESEVQQLSFKNSEVKRGPQNTGRAEHRVSNKPV